MVPLKAEEAPVFQNEYHLQWNGHKVTEITRQPTKKALGQYRMKHALQARQEILHNAEVRTVFQQKKKPTSLSTKKHLDLAKTIKINDKESKRALRRQMRRGSSEEGSSSSEELFI